MFSLLADTLGKSKGMVREKIIEEILNELVYFSDDLVSELLFPEGSDFDWSKYNRFVNNPFYLIQVGDEILYDVGDRRETDTVVSKKGNSIKVSKGKSVKSSMVRSVDRNDKDWYRIDDDDIFNRTVWLHETMQNNKE